MIEAPEAVPPRRLLQQFGRFPQPGRVKRRLAATIGDRAACAVHEELLAATARTLLASQVAPAELWLDRTDAHALLNELCDEGLEGPHLQLGEDLGERMLRAISAGLARADAVVLVGSDCPGLTPAYLEEAFSALEAADVVLGPAEDGGYVLIGMRAARREIFEGVPWGSDRVLETTLGNAAAGGLDVALLATLYDVDHASDLRRWREECGQ